MPELAIPVIAGMIIVDIVKLYNKPSKDIFNTAVVASLERLAPRWLVPGKTGS